MPTYQYLCTECGHGLDVHQGFTDEALTVCPECAGKLRKVFSAVGVVFKGSGFYKTDSRASNDGKPLGASTAAGSGASADSSSSNAGTSDSKSGSTGADSSKPTSPGSGSSSSGDTKAKTSAPASA